MFRSLLVAALLLFAPAAGAADLGAPKAKAPAVYSDTPDHDRWSGCFLEAGGAAKSFLDPYGGAQATALHAGVGCSARVAPGSKVVIGGLARYGVTVDDVSAGFAREFGSGGFAGVRAGVLVSPSALVYAIGGYDFGTDIKGPAVGAGLEVKPWDNYSLAVEFTRTYVQDGDMTENGRGGTVLFMVRRGF